MNNVAQRQVEPSNEGSTAVVSADATDDVANPAARCRNGMSIDIEDYFQVWAFADQIDRRDWDSMPSRIEISVDRALQVFSDNDVKATFFILGWIAERFPDLIKRIAGQGHEIASHGYSHLKVTEQTKAAFREDVVRAKDILENLCGEPVRGYRAPSFSIGEDNLWALDVLEETGHVYSSSIYPIRHDHYGMPSASRFAFRPTKSGILEVPMSTIDIGAKRLPCSGGGYFRLLPYPYFKYAYNRLNRQEGQPGIFYFHPWELDPDQPRIETASTKSRFRHYVNLHRMESKLRRLLQDFEWDRLDRVFLTTSDTPSPAQQP